MMDEQLERAFCAAYQARNRGRKGRSKAWRLLVAMAMLAATPLLAQGPAAAAAETAAQFAKKSGTAQKRIAASVVETADAVGGASLDAIRAIVAAGAARDSEARQGKGKGKGKGKLKTKKPKKRAPKANGTSWQLPAMVQYTYGRRTIDEFAGSASKKQALARRVAVELTLLGMLPETDRALAELERTLDSDRGADEFAAFLEMWRNGDESFYEALDRTAGTEDSVFFYDVMLGDFVAAFVKGKDAASRKVKKGLNASHDALHDAFLSYRQYRAFREAVALSLVLPPDVPLPQRLQRYEEKSSGNSLRDQVLMMLALHDYDAMAVARKVRDTADAMAQPLWKQRYDPYPAWSKLFQESIPEMLKKAASTEEFHQQAVDQRLQEARKLRKVAAMSGLAPT